MPLVTDYTFTKTGIERPYIPERDLIRLIKYGTYDLLELDSIKPGDIDRNELTDDEYELIDLWYCDIAGETE